MIYFITGNKAKLAETQAILEGIQGLDIDLPEVQDIDPHIIIKEKLQQAHAIQKGRFIVEDTSLALNALQGLPGPLIKWFLKTVGNEGLANLASKLGDSHAEAKVVVGYAENPGNMIFFEGAVKGTIVSPRGDKGFGWDPIFIPDGHLKTFAEMDTDEKNAVSMRKIALEKLRNYLRTNP